MSTYLSTRVRTAVVLLTLVAILAVSVFSVQANIRLGNGGDVPFYARLAQDSFVSDGEWVAVIFYRPPGCIDPDFDLLEFFHEPAAFSCKPYTTDGFSIWKNGPEVDLAPLKSHLHGLGAVPVWFVSEADMVAGIADGSLLIGELADMDSLMIGSADFFSEELHPSEAKLNSMIQIVARGQLEDGRSFYINALGVAASGHYHTTIRFD
jgi:hypothetical protein